MTTELLLSIVIPVLGGLLLIILLVYGLSMLLQHLRQSYQLTGFQKQELSYLKKRFDRLSPEQTEKANRMKWAWQGHRKFKICNKVLEAETICSFYLAPHDERPLPPFQPGQFLTFELQVNGQSKPVIRCYSLSDAPTHPEYYRVTIKRIPPPPKDPDKPPGVGSGYFHNQLRIDDIIDVKAPSGNFYLDTQSDAPVVLIGGGIGITPVLSMANYLADSGSRREVWFFYGVRNGLEHIQKEHLNTLEEIPNFHVRVCYSDPLDTDIKGEDFQVSARVSIELLKQELGVNNYQFYICGPPPMMNALTSDLAAWGVPESDVHSEAFGPASVKKEAVAAVEGVQIQFSKCGRSLSWDGSHPNLLTFGEDNGIGLPSGCRAGNCGECMVALRSGKVTYVGPHSATIESGSFLTCCSIPDGAITIDA